MHEHDEAPRTSALAVASFVLGLLSPVLCLFTGIPAIICGALAISRIGRSSGRETGSGFASMGIGLGVLATMLSVLGIPFAYIGLQPVYQAMQTEQHRRADARNLEQIGLAMRMYSNECGSLPPVYSADAGGMRLHSWRTLLLPYLDESQTRPDLDHAWNHPANRALSETRVTAFDSPLDETNEGLDTSYVAVVDPEFAFTGDGFVDPSDIEPNTAMIVQISGAQIPWARPVDLTWDEFIELYQFRSISSDPRGVRALFSDGSVKEIPYGLSPEELRGLFTRAGGEGSGSI